MRSLKDMVTVTKNTQGKNGQEVTGESGVDRSSVRDARIGKITFAAVAVLGSSVLSVISGDVTYIPIGIWTLIILLPLFIKSSPDTFETIGWSLRQIPPQLAKKRNSEAPINDAEVKDYPAIIDSFSGNNSDSVDDAIVNRSDLDLFEVYGLSGRSEQSTILGSRNETLAYKEGSRND